MLPIPFLKYIPSIFKNDSLAVLLASKIDIDLTSWAKDILSLRRFNRSDECPEIVLDELGFLLSAGIKNQDSELIRRKKIKDAVLTHKNRSTFQSHAKLVIDTITGLSPGASLIDSVGTGSWIVTGDGTEPTLYYWSSVGSDGIDDDLGLEIGGDGLRDEDAGVVRINLHEGVTTPVISEAVLNQIKNEIESDIEPAYFLIILGYVDGNGIFVSYDDLYEFSITPDGVDLVTPDGIDIIII